MKKYMTSHLLIRTRDTASIQEAARLMCDMSMGALGVDHEHEFVGIITERDLVWAMAQGKDPHDTTVGELVNDFPIVVEGPISPAEAATRMRAGHVRHLIVRENGTPRIISIRDLLDEYIGGPPTLEHNASATELRRMFGVAF